MFKPTEPVRNLSGHDNDIASLSDLVRCRIHDKHQKVLNLLQMIDLFIVVMIVIAKNMEKEKKNIIMVMLMEMINCIEYV